MIHAQTQLFGPAVLRSLVALLALAAAPAFAQDAAEFVVRMNRLEGQVRQMAGQIEQLQFENRQLKEQLRKFQEDVDFRFQDGRGPDGRGAARAEALPVSPPTTTQTPVARAPRRGDAFDPSEMPNAPGAPRPLGTTLPSPPLTGPVGAVAPPRSVGADEPDDEAPGGPLDISGRTVSGRGVAGGAARPAPPSVAASPTGDPRADFEAAYAYMLQKQYDRAEMAFRHFLQSHPRDRLGADATFWLGETYLQRNRHREAAEQFLKVSTEYARSTKAPDAMLKLGIALSALGAREQACATFAELERKFPQAAPSVRQGVEREQKRARCA